MWLGTSTILFCPLYETNLRTSTSNKVSSEFVYILTAKLEKLFVILKLFITFSVIKAVPQYLHIPASYVSSTSIFAPHWVHFAATNGIHLYFHKIFYIHFII